jgi:hypothetical protein
LRPRALRVYSRSTLVSRWNKGTAWPEIIIWQQ